MRKVWLIIPLAIVVSIFIYLLIRPGTQQILSSPNAKSTCNTLYLSGDNKINLVFLSTKDQAKRYSDFLFTIKPYSKSDFNVYYIDDFNPTCELYQSTSILCYSKDVISRASACPNDAIIVLKDYSSEIRSSSYMGVISININHPLTVLPHELAHVIAGLADEYVPATLPKGAPNCKESCQSFNIPSLACSQGCSLDSLFRSIDNGLMRTLKSEDYGTFNQKVIRGVLSSSSPITGKATNDNNDPCATTYYLVKGNYSNNELTIFSKSLEQGCINSINNGPFNYSVTLKDGSSTTKNFNAEIIFTDVQNDTDPTIKGGSQIYQGLFMLRVPVLDNGETLTISKEGQPLTTLFLQEDTNRPCEIL